jgi:hypothetical protein
MDDPYERNVTQWHLSRLHVPTASNITVTTGEPDFLDILIVFLAIGRQIVFPLDWRVHRRSVSHFDRVAICSITSIS